jgi:hypothetical protein
VALCVVCACGDNTVPFVPEPWTNGERFHADVYRYGEVALLAGWYDSTLGLDCTVPQIANNNCPPFVEVLFSDPDCKQMFAVTGGDRGQYFQDGFGFYQVVAPYTGPAYSAVDGCHAVGDQTGMRVEPALASLFESRRITRHHLGSLGYDALDGDDGSQQIVGIDDSVVVVPPLSGRLLPRYETNSVLRATATPDSGYDSDFGLPCHPSHSPSGGLRCAVDSIEAVTPLHALTHDQTCTMGFEIATIGQPGYIVHEMATLDGLPALLGQNWHCAMEATGMPWYERQGDCTAVTGTIYLCASLPDEAFAKLDIERE